MEEIYKYLKFIEEETLLSNNHSDKTEFVLKGLFVSLSEQEILTQFIENDIFSFDFPDEETAFYFKLKYCN